MAGPVLGRLVNHGFKSERNAVMKVINCDGRPHLCLFSSSEIRCGDQILYDYGVGVKNLNFQQQQVIFYNNSISIRWMQESIYQINKERHHHLLLTHSLLSCLEHLHAQDSLIICYWFFCINISSPLRFCHFQMNIIHPQTLVSQGNFHSDKLVITIKLFCGCR